ncbi:hypothetical protein Aph02nite_67130 [Actinoplanes philippinensis]|uniref:Uncharacterized protein n=1 Tax=Actinoplanes philippinensis TaxID=35752 RepID=A0A1I2KY17_9ACTN|nr:hypothetical protein [Actinoplanes philippinensis]GIE80763.1 hypothetical protein Aph02nite_67130 [Actinoplanes philippinensis]SFF71855.1 hypothetical protein SAMN05421541_11931 [Actinoplanes philippinensis]
MRHVIATLLAGGALLTVSACGTAPGAPGSGAGGATAAVTTPPAGAACEALAQVYGTKMAPYAKALTTLATDPATIAQAQQSLAAFATAVQDATDTSADAGLKAAGKKAAEQMQKKSTDEKFFRAIKTPDDVNKAVGPTLSSWLAPVQQHCS